jgi:hypothetical protein
MLMLTIFHDPMAKTFCLASFLARKSFCLKMKNHQHQHKGKPHTQEKFQDAAISVEDAILILEVLTYVAHTVLDGDKVEILSEKNLASRWFAFVKYQKNHQYKESGPAHAPKLYITKPGLIKLKLWYILSFRIFIHGSYIYE